MDVKGQLTEILQHFIQERFRFLTQLLQRDCFFIVQVPWKQYPGLYKGLVFSWYIALSIPTAGHSESLDIIKVRGLLNCAKDTDQIKVFSLNFSGLCFQGPHNQITTRGKLCKVHCNSDWQRYDTMRNVIATDHRHHHHQHSQSQHCHQHRQQLLFFI